MIVASEAIVMEVVYLYNMFCVGHRPGRRPGLFPLAWLMAAVWKPYMGIRTVSKGSEGFRSSSIASTIVDTFCLIPHPVATDTSVQS